MIELKLKNKSVKVEALKDFGFVDGRFEKEVCEGQFLLTLQVAQDGRIFSKVTDKISGDEYVLHLVEDSTGSYVGAVRQEYDAVVEKFIGRCCEENIFRGELTRRLIEHVREKYGDELEFLWEKFPDAAIWRRKDSRKWYGALMKIVERKLSLNSDKEIEILDLRGAAAELVDGEKIFPGWHMNKKNWITIRLEGSVDFEEICRRLDESYKLAVK